MNKPRDWLNHLVDNKAMGHNVVISEVNPNGDFILRFPTKEQAELAMDRITGVKAKNGMVLAPSWVTGWELNETLSEGVPIEIQSWFERSRWSLQNVESHRVVHKSSCE